jgi:hypothetical protein
MATSAQLEILRNQTRRACEAWSQSSCARNRVGAKNQIAACERASSAWELLTLVAQNAGADRAAQEELGRRAPAADAARLRMLVLHRELLGQDRLFGTLVPAQKQVVDALRAVTAAQISALRGHALRLRDGLGPDGNGRADLDDLLA